MLLGGRDAGAPRYPERARRDRDHPAHARRRHRRGVRAARGAGHRPHPGAAGREDERSACPGGGSMRGGSMRKVRPVGRILSVVAAAALPALLSACHSSPPPYQPPDRHKKPEPEQAAIANMKMALEYIRLNNLAPARERIERALGEAP